jgi:hypothetical protein
MDGVWKAGCGIAFEVGLLVVPDAALLLLS